MVSAPLQHRCSTSSYLVSSAGPLLVCADIPATINNRTPAHAAYRFRAGNINLMLGGCVATLFVNR